MLQNASHHHRAFDLSRGWFTWVTKGRDSACCGRCYSCRFWKRIWKPTISLCMRNVARIFDKSSINFTHSDLNFSGTNSSQVPFREHSNPKYANQNGPFRWLFPFLQSLKLTRTEQKKRNICLFGLVFRPLRDTRIFFSCKTVNGIFLISIVTRTVKNQRRQERSMSCRTNVGNWKLMKIYERLLQIFEVRKLENRLRCSTIQNANWILRPKRTDLGRVFELREGNGEISIRFRWNWSVSKLTLGWSFWENPTALYDTTCYENFA